MNEKTICFVCLRDRDGHPDLIFQDADLCADCGDSNAFMIGQMMADEGFTKYANPYSGYGLTKDAERWDNGWEYGKHKQL